MGFLQQFLCYQKICLQCHNNPDADAVASAYGLYCFFTSRGISTEIIYGGTARIKKSSLAYLIEHCHIPIRHVEELPSTQLLLVVDGQYGVGNVAGFHAPAVATIDHHVRLMPQEPQVLIQSDYQSCSTVVWELLMEEGYPVKENEWLRVALLYGLFTDTSSFYDLYQEKDMAMRMELLGDLPLFERLTKSSMTVAELMIASDAMQEHYFDPQHRFSIVCALRCDQAVLGIIGDFMIQVDVILLNLTYTDVNGGYQISIRSCDDQIHANLVAAHLCQGVGSGGGHLKKSGGQISRESLTKAYGPIDIWDYLHQRLVTFLDNH